MPPMTIMIYPITVQYVGNANCLSIRRNPPATIAASMMNTMMIRTNLLDITVHECRLMRLLSLSHHDIMDMNILMQRYDL